jgi:hypothetical protein
MFVTLMDPWLVWKLEAVQRGREREREREFLFERETEHLWLRQLMHGEEIGTC